MMQQRIKVAWVAALCLAGSSLFGQTATDFARMNQDVLMLNERVQKLMLAVDVMQRENEQLKRTLDAQVKAQSALLARFESYTSSIDARLAGGSSRESLMKKEIIAEVSQQINKLAAETQKAIDALAKAQSSTPQISTSVNFSEDYPQEGIAYVVQPGDTLSGIAKKFNSTVRDIQNANRIANPSGLQAGKTIFVPQR